VAVKHCGCGEPRKEREKVTRGRTEEARRNPAAGALFLALALLALVSVAGFHPEHSLLLFPEGGGQSAHLLGPLFQKIASWLHYFLGRGAYFLIFALFYQAVLNIRVMKPATRVGLSLCSPGALAAFLALMDSSSPVAHRGGGLLGRLIAESLGARLREEATAPLAGVLFGGFLLLMFGSQIRRAIAAAKRSAAARAGGREAGRRGRERKESVRRRRASGGETGSEAPVFEPGEQYLARAEGGGEEERGAFPAHDGEPEKRIRHAGAEKLSPRGSRGMLREFLGRIAGRTGGRPRHRSPARRRKPPLVQKVVFEGDLGEGRGSLGPRAFAPGAAARGADAGGGNGDGVPPAGRAAVPVNSRGKGSASAGPRPRQPGSAGRQPPGRQPPGRQGEFSYHKEVLYRSRPVNRKEMERETSRKAQELERTLKDFGIQGKVTGITRGPVITRYELQPAPGVKLNRIVNLSNNIALSLSANGVRIEAPIPGRSAVGIEIPNEEREMVTLGDIIEHVPGDAALPLILGKDLSGSVVVSDLAAMPHLLIAGATGAGKSVCVNALIMSLLFHRGHQDVRFIMIDPKMVELKIYNGIPHLLTEVITDPRDAAKALRWVLHEMENRYRLLDESSVRNIQGYNQKNREKLPYIVIIVDEFANLMAISQKEVEDTVVRLAAMSRAVGIHVIMATQWPSVDVITGLIKANFPYRVAFQVASKTDSRTILDMVGAEKLLGKGDMLFAPAGSMHIQRIQGAYVSEEEVMRVVDELSTVPAEYEDLFDVDQQEGFSDDYEDMMFDQAVEIVLKTKRASASFLQRRLKIGYNRAARLIEIMEEKGIIGPPRGSKPREIYIDRMD
jgi:hypothetical protein